LNNERFKNGAWFKPHDDDDDGDQDDDDQGREGGGEEIDNCHQTTY